MMSQARRALLSALPVLRAGKPASLPMLWGPAVSTTVRCLRPAPLQKPACRAAFTTEASVRVHATSDQGGGGVTTTMSRCAPVTVQGRHVFEVTGYSLLRGLGVGRWVEWAAFSVGGYDWCIEFYPDGKTEEDDDYYNRCSYSDEDGSDCEDDEGHVSVFVTLVSKDVDNVRTLCDLSLVSPGQPPWVRSRKRKKPKLFDEEGDSFGFGKFRQRSDLEDSEYLRDDCFRIQCDIKVITGMQVMQLEAPSSSSFDVQVPPSHLLDDIRKSLEEEKKADVTFKVKEKMFHAHRFVLATRAPFFDAELNNGARGGVISERQHITIEDMEPAVFKALLHFIYTDSLPAMDDLQGIKKEERVKSLLVAADRCGLERMKLMCASMLCKGLKVENMATTLVLADQHRCRQLKDACIEFVNSTESLDAVIASPGYI